MEEDFQLECQHHQGKVFECCLFWYKQGLLKVDYEGNTSNFKGVKSNS